MKKNLLSIVILSLLVVNIALTAVMMFSVLKTNDRTAAIVTDIGAPLSHAAIVAREFGIPAVVGCGNATTVIKSGDRIRVDGASGGVTLLQ